MNQKNKLEKSKKFRLKFPKIFNFWKTIFKKLKIINLKTIEKEYLKNEKKLKKYKFY